MSPRIPTAPGTAIGLVRVSTDEQAKGGLSLEQQRRTLQEAADRLGLDLVRVVEEAGVSGGRDVAKRDGLLEAIEAVPKGGVLLVAKRDRVARDMFVMSWVEKELMKRDARLISAQGEGTDPDTDPIQALILKTVTDMHAQLERLQAQLRTRVVLAGKKRRGEKLGGRVPMGFAVEQVETVDRNGEPRQLKVLVPDPAEQAALKLAVKLRDEGKSLRQVGTALVAAGHRPRHGKQWHAKVVRDMVARLQELDAVTDARIARLRASEGR